MAPVANILMAVAAVIAPVAKVLAQVALVLTAVADVLATLLTSVVVPDLARVPPQFAAILADFMVVAAKLACIAMNRTPVRPKLVRFARRHSTVTGNVWMCDRLCAHDGRTCNEQRRGNSGHSEIAHCIPQRQYPARAAVACAACTTVGRRRTLRADLFSPQSRQLLPSPHARLAPRFAGASVRQPLWRNTEVVGGRICLTRPASRAEGSTA
jgi:hypothetical protein